jgi:tRNA A37 threonylcarbamoyladenosine synthetase subunit TsaC/SUA5/YrdC
MYAKCAQNLYTATGNRRYSASANRPGQTPQTSAGAPHKEERLPMQFDYLTALVSAIGLIVVASDVAEWFILGGL